MTDELELEAAFDRTRIERGRPSRRFFLVKVCVGQPMCVTSVHRLLHLALVLDRSGSMGGKRLRAALQAVDEVTQTLGEGDSLSLVAFNDETETLAENRPMTCAGRDALVQRASDLTAGGYTNLTDGWLAGAECLARSLLRGDGRHQRVLLLSDGKANRGVVDPEEIAAHAAELLRRGIVSSAIGIGDDYSTTQLHAIAGAGGGELHDAEHPGEIAEVVAAELGQAVMTIAEDVRLEIELPPGVDAVGWSDQPLTETGTRRTCTLGALSEGEPRDLLLCVDVERVPRVDELPFRVQAEWRPAGGVETRLSAPMDLALVPSDPHEVAAERRDTAVSLRVAHLWQSRLVREAVRLNRRRDLARVHQRITAELPALRRYCEDLPGAEALVQELEATLALSRRTLHERSRKEIDLAHYKRTILRPDARSMKRGPWVGFLER